MPQAIIPSSADVVIRKSFMVRCKDCAIWRPMREDSVADDFGICPKKVYPYNQTHAEDGCTEAVLPLE